MIDKGVRKQPKQLHTFGTRQSASNHRIQNGQGGWATLALIWRSPKVEPNCRFANMPDLSDISQKGVRCGPKFGWSAFCGKNFYTLKSKKVLLCRKWKIFMQNAISLRSRSAQSFFQAFMSNWRRLFQKFRVISGNKVPTLTSFLSRFKFRGWIIAH